MRKVRAWNIVPASCCARAMAAHSSSSLLTPTLGLSEAFEAFVFVVRDADGHRRHVRAHGALWVRRDGDDCDLIFAGAIAPEDAVCAGGAVLRVRLEDLLMFVVWMDEGMEFVGLQAWMPGVGGKEL